MIGRLALFFSVVAMGLALALCTVAALFLGARGGGSARPGVSVVAALDARIVRADSRARVLPN